jgi:TRAP-type C4-dicarboxylate transport system permease small subunit
MEVPCLLMFRGMFIMRILAKGIMLIDRWAEEFLCCVLLSILMTMIMVQVFCRYILLFSFSWNEELARFVFIWLVYLGVSLGAKHNEHIRVTILNNFLTAKNQKVIRYIADTGWFIFCTYVCFLGIQMLQTMFHYKHLSASLQWNTAYVYMIIPLAFFLTSFRILQYYYRKWKGVSNLRGVGDESA